MLTRKLVALIVCVLLLSSLLSGCNNILNTAAQPAEGGQEGSNKETIISGKITFLNQRTDFMMTLWPKIKDEFKRKYPDVELTIDAQTDLDRVMKVKMSANEVPDIWTVFPNVYTKEQLAQANIPLDGMDFAEDLIEADADQFRGSDGKLYAAPQGRSLGGIVVYNKKIFAELDIIVPTTLDELIAAGKKIADTGKIAMGTSAKAQWPLFPYEVYLPMYFSGDENILNRLSDSDEPFTGDSSFAMSYNLLRTLKDEGIIEKDPLSKNWEPFKKDFQAGNVAMFFTDSWFVPQATIEGGAVKPEDIGVFAMPFDNNSENRYACYKLDSGLGAARNSQNPEAAEAFLEFMMNDAYETYARECGTFFSSRKSIPFEYDYNTELKITNEMMQPARTVETSDIIARGQIDFSKKFQEILAGRTVGQVLEDLNKSWKKGKTGK